MTASPTDGPPVVDTPPGGRPTPGRTLAILTVAALAYTLSQTTLVPALGPLERELGTTTTGVSWTLTGFLLSAAVATPLFGRLGDMFGKKRLLVIALLIFGAGALIAALGTSIGVVVAGRVVMGLGGGIFPLCFAIIRDEFPPERVAVSIGLISSTFGIGGGLGLVVGGLMVDGLGVASVFWLGAVSAGLGAIAAALFVPESAERRPARIDWAGALLLAIGVTLPLLAISNANTWGWGSPRTLGLLAAGAVLLALWVQLELRVPSPLANVRSLGSPVIATTNLATALVGFGMFGSFLLTPTLLELPTSTGYGFGYSATTAGLVILPGALAMVWVGPWSGRLAQRFGPKLPMLLGCVCAAVGLGLLGFFHGGVIPIAIFSLVLSVGMAFAFSSMPNLIFLGVPAHETGEATGFNTLMRSVGSSAGSAVSAAVLVAGTATIAGAAVPSESAYTTAYLVCAGVALLSAVVSAVIPTGRLVGTPTTPGRAAATRAPA
jgi:MFS family permease